MQPHSISIFFPMYNERQNIAKVLDEAQRIIPELGFKDYEILIIDDGSQDGSEKIVDECARHNPHIRMVRHPHNLGYGAALRTGFTHASKDLVFYTDCDLPVDLRDIGKALPLLAQADLVIGYRIKRYETLRRAIYSRIYNFLMRVLFDVHVRDVNFSFKVVKKEALERIYLTASTVFIDGQLLAESRRYGFWIAELPIEYKPRRFGSSNFDSIKTAWATLTELLAYRWALWFEPAKVPPKSKSVDYRFE